MAGRRWESSERHVENVARRARAALDNATMGGTEVGGVWRPSSPQGPNLQCPTAMPHLWSTALHGNTPAID